MKNSENSVISINRPKIITANITIIGDTPLIVHAWSDKAKEEILDKEMKKATTNKAKAARDPFVDFMDAAYWIDGMPKDKTPEGFKAAIEAGARFGFPLTGIKQAALSACYRAGLIPNQTGMKSSFFLNNPDGTGELGIIESIDGSPMIPEMREDMVQVGGMSKSADLRYRPEFKNWKMRLCVTLIDTGVFDLQSIVNAIDLGGQMCGIGEWRIERDGDFGRFHVEGV